jgi:hypothetical protein
MLPPLIQHADIPEAHGYAPLALQEDFSHGQLALAWQKVSEYQRALEQMNRDCQDLKFSDEVGNYLRPACMIAAPRHLAHVNVNQISF